MSNELIPQEIDDIPAAIRATLEETRAAAQEAARVLRQRNPRRIYIIGNGTSYYTSLAASYTARALAGPNDPLVLAVIAGDFLHYPPMLNKNDVLVGVSASGEFRDILTLFEQVKGQCLRVGITHVPGSSITKLSDCLLISKGEPSRVPVMTKTYASTLTAIHLLLLEFFEAPETYYTDLVASASRTEDAIAQAKLRTQAIVSELSVYDHAFCFGAGNGYAAALECALKMKEMTLLHAEGSETWEMASGPATMVNGKTFCIALYTGSKGDEATASGAKHARDWGARVLDIGPKIVANDLYLPVSVPNHEAFASFSLVAPVALLAYYLARERGINPDKPHWQERYHSQGMTHILGS